MLPNVIVVLVEAELRNLFHKWQGEAARGGKRKTQVPEIALKSSKLKSGQKRPRPKARQNCAALCWLGSKIAASRSARHFTGSRKLQSSLLRLICSRHTVLFDNAVELKKVLTWLFLKSHNVQSSLVELHAFLQKTGRTDLPNYAVMLGNDVCLKCYRVNNHLVKILERWIGLDSAALLGGLLMCPTLSQMLIDWCILPEQLLLRLCWASSLE